MPRIIGSEKQKHGGAVYTVLIDPGTVAANTNIPLPDWAKGAQDMLQCFVFRGSDGTAAAETYTKTVVARGTPAPGTGEACLYDDNNIRLGDATTTRDLILVTLIYKSFTKEI